MNSEKSIFELWLDGIGTDPNGFLSSLFNDGMDTKVTTTKKKKKSRKGQKNVVKKKD